MLSHVMAQISIIFILFMSYFYGRLSRMNGGGAPKLPFGLDAHIVALPFGIAGALLGQFFLPFLPFILPDFWFVNSVTVPAAIVGFLIAYASAFLGKRLGHGQYFDLASFSGRIISAEKIDFLVRLFFKKDPLTEDPYGKTPFWRDFFGLSLTGVAMTIGLASLAAMAGHTIWMFILLMSGALKAFSYALPKKHPEQVRGFMEDYMYVKFDGPGHTEPGEWIYGWIGGLALFSYIVYLMWAIFGL